MCKSVEDTMPSSWLFMTHIRISETTQLNKTRNIHYNEKKFGYAS